MVSVLNDLGEGAVRCSLGEGAVIGAGGLCEVDFTEAAEDDSPGLNIIPAKRSSVTGRIGAGRASRFELVWERFGAPDELAPWLDPWLDPWLEP